MDQNAKKLFRKTHEWIAKQEDGSVYIGISNHAQEALGDLVFVNLPQEGDALTAGKVFADVESVKAVSDIYSPVSGEVVEVNEALIDRPELINESPYEAWLVKVDQVTETEELLSQEAYEAFLAEEA